MIHLNMRHVGFYFAPNCPEYVKQRTIINVLPRLKRGDPVMIPLCDQQWVRPYEGVVPGWWIPVVGFIPDEQINKRFKRLFTTLLDIVWLRKR